MADVPPTQSSTSMRSKREPKSKPVSPIEAAVKSWLENLPRELCESISMSAERILQNTPKRWVVYPPMVLLPSESFGDQWWAAIGVPHMHIETSWRDELWSRILDLVGKREGKGLLTHLAINAGIPLYKAMEKDEIDRGAEAGKREDGARGENILRTPSGLIMLYGDFGPALQPDHEPNEQDMKEALWVSTKQNGIVQIWAPRYSMFSRGNVKEKARLLDFHSPNQILESGRKNATVGMDNSALDLYAGIGYFVFSYMKMGMRKVVGWELNPWSVEGLRRGALANGWSVRVVKAHEQLGSWDEQIIVFLEDNGKALERLRGVGQEELGRVQHVNCGLLPTSDGSWEMALRMVKGDAWLHLHENVRVDDAERRKGEIEKVFRGWLQEANDERGVKVEHVEFVKTFAPGVWHCVFDVYISKNDSQT